MRAAAATLAVVAGLAVVPMGGCQTGPAKASTSDLNAGAADGSTAIQRLEQRAAEELNRPDDRVRTLPAPPGVEAEAVAELPADASAAAFADLETALQAVAPPAEAAAAEAAPPADGENRMRGVRAYITGRTALLRGDAKTAISALEAATRYDPGSPDVWRELAEAQLALGRRSAAMTSFERAVAAGSDDIRVFTALGHEYLRLRRTEVGLRHLLRAWSLRDGHGDPAAPLVVAADLGEVLRSAGYFRAAAEMFEHAATLPEAFGGATQFRSELSELYRRQSDLWRDAGDLHCRLGEYQAALDAYDQAAQSPTLDVGKLVARRVHASMRLGRPASAAAVVLGQIADAQGLVEDSQFALVRYLAGSTDVGPLLAQSLRQVSSELASPAPATITSRLTRAEAAASSGDSARRLLRTHLSSFPDDDAAGRELLQTYGADETQARVREIVQLTQNRPLYAKRYAFWLVDGGRPSAPYLAELQKESRRSATAAIMRAYILAFNGHPQDGLAAAQAVEPRKDDGGAVQLARVELAAACGSWQAAETALAALDRPGDEVARARALHELQRDDEALTVLEPIADGWSGDPAATPVVLLAADLATNAGKPEKAEEWLRKLLVTDPFNEGAAEAIIRLYMPGGAMPDQGKLTSAVRALRDNVPSSRTLRYFNAGELAQRQLYREAETTLLGLVEDDLSNGAVLNDLITTWERQITAGDHQAAARAEAWLRSQLRERPESLFLTGGLARVLASDGRGKEASEFLAEQLRTTPRPELARLRESIIREVLKNPEEADTLARERLKSLPPGVEAVIEQIDLLVRGGELDRAAEALTTSLPAHVQLTRDQAGRVGVICARAAAAVGNEVRSARARALGRLLDAAVRRDVRLSPPLHERRLAILAGMDNPDAEAIAEAAALTGRQYPTAAAEAYLLAARLLSTDSKGAAAIRVLEIGAERIQPPNVNLLVTWLRTVARSGDGAALDRLFEAFDRDELMAPMIQAFSADGEESAPADRDARRAELAYVVGNMLSGAHRGELAERAYRRALAIKPDHAWTANNLGYQMLEEGRNLDEVEVLLESAYRGLPDEPSVIDSIGWLRYKQRILEDQAGADGHVTREGAVTLLTRAVDLPAGRLNSVLHDHLGDALAAAGRTAEAIDRWSEAMRLAGAEMDAMRRAANLPEAEERRLSTLITTLQDKIVAARNGQKPALPAPFGE